MTTPTIFMTETELVNYLGTIDKFVPNLGLTYSKVLDMNKYLDFKANGKANPNPYYEGVVATYVMSNLQTGFEYDAQIGRKAKAEGIIITELSEEEKSAKKPIWYNLQSVALAKHKTKDSYYFRYQSHANSSYLKTTFEYQGQPIEKFLFEAYTKDTSTDYSKYQHGISNPCEIKVVGIDKIQRLAINKQEIIIVR